MVFPSVKLSATISVTPHSNREGQIITLTCKGTADPLKTTSQLESYINVEWVGPTGVPLTEENNIVVGDQRQSLNGVVRTLTLNGTRYNQTGWYTCHVVLNTTNTDLQISVAEYHLVLHRKYVPDMLFQTIHSFTTTLHTFI